MFNGIFAGWNILCKMFKKDNMFCTELPSTDLLTKPEVDCTEQGKCFPLKKAYFHYDCKILSKIIKKYL